ncbi:MAG TPA: hypothetical protein V6C78_11305, partial [Crinalium sp.]
DCGFCAPNGRTKPAISFTMRIAVMVRHTCIITDAYNRYDHPPILSYQSTEQHFLTNSGSVRFRQVNQADTLIL